jgi:hypothetical protein
MQCLHEKMETCMTSFEIRADDVLLTIEEYCDKYHRSRPTYYRDTP